MRRFITIFLLLLLPLQGFAMQGGWLPTNENSFAHELDHLKKTSHHHHNDGSLHYDESEESVHHASEHSACQHAVALPSAGIHSLKFSLVTIAPRESGRSLPDPIPERPQRPPRPALG